MNAPASDLLAGLGWLTFHWPCVAHALVAVHLLSDLLGEKSLTAWLLVTCLDLPRRHGRTATNH